MNLLNQFTPKDITKLNSNEIFVFSTDRLGVHRSARAKQAVQLFGAKKGIGEGLFGQSYAIYLRDKDSSYCNSYVLRKQILELYKFAKQHFKLLFYVTDLSNSSKTYSNENIAKIFKELEEPPINVILPMQYSVIKGIKGFNEDLTCNPTNIKGAFQYKRNTTFKTKFVKLCEEGFHFCKNGYETLLFYPWNSWNKFANVSGSRIIETDNISKVAVSEIKILDLINIDQVLSAGRKYMYNLKELYFNIIKLNIDKFQNHVINKYTYLYTLNNNPNERYSITDKCNKIISNISKILFDRGCSGILSSNSVIFGENCNSIICDSHNNLSLKSYNKIFCKICNTVEITDYNEIDMKHSVLVGGNYNTILSHQGSQVFVQDRNIIIGENYSKIRCKNNNQIIVSDGAIIETLGTNNVIIVTLANYSPSFIIKCNVGDTIIIKQKTKEKNNDIIIITKVIDGSKYEAGIWYTWKNNDLAKLED